MYKQCDAAWGSKTLGKGSKTICKAGCAMSSVAMYVTSRGTKKTPGTLNDWLNSNGGYAGSSKNLLVWSAVNSLGVSY